MAACQLAVSDDGLDATDVVGQALDLARRVSVRNHGGVRWRCV
jgi:hypothetical protein